VVLKVIGTLVQDLDVVKLVLIKSRPCYKNSKDNDILITKF